MTAGMRQRVEYTRIDRMETNPSNLKFQDMAIVMLKAIGKAMTNSDVDSDVAMKSDA